MIKLEIVDGSLQISISGSIILIAPKNSCAIDVLALYNSEPYIFIYNKFLGTSTAIFEKPLADCEDSTGTPFTVNSFIAFAEANLGFDGSSTPITPSPFRYDANATGIEPILGNNNASGYFSTIGGGQFNDAIGINSTIGGGCANTASYYYGTVSGGYGNTSLNQASTIGGGRNNCALTFASTIGGGFQNTASGYCSIIGGGSYNTASGTRSTIGGGGNITASGYISTIGGGGSNTASGSCSFVGGGFSNTASGLRSSILGGQRNNTNTCADAMIVGSCITANRACTAFVNDLSVCSFNTCSGCLVGVSTDGLLVPVSSVACFGSFYDTTTQTALGVNTPTPMSFNSTSVSNGVSISGGNQIVVSQDGYYNIQFSAQLDRVAGSGVESIDIWFRKNGNNIPNSNSKVTMMGNVNKSHLVASWNFIGQINVGETIQIIWLTPTVDIKLVYEAENLIIPHPAIPSVILTVIKI